MRTDDHLGVYVQGWTEGAAQTILRVATDDYVFDDPNTGQIARADFGSYMDDLKKIVASIRGEGYSGPFMEITEATVREDDDGLTAWCWWSIPGTPIQGSGVIKANNNGVRHERIAYYTKLSV